MAILSKIAAVFSAILMLVGLSVVVAPATASACPRDEVFAIGGVGDPQAGGFAARGNRVVVYSAKLNAMEEGISSLKREIDGFRSVCPGSKIIVTGFSQGAAIAHVYLTRHGHEIRHNAHAVLFSDPKMHPSGESNGVFWLGGVPVRGTDANFGGVRTVSVCYLEDIICNRSARSGWVGYVNGNHGNYNFDARYYSGVVGNIYY